MAKVKFTQEQLKSFEDFKNQIPTFLNELKTLLNKKIDSLSYDKEEMVEVIEYYINLCQNSTPLKDAKLSQIFIVYYGEAIRNHLGGDWNLNDVKEDPTFNTPVIIGWGKNSENLRLSPLENLIKIQEDKNRNYLIEQIEETKNMSKKISEFAKKWGLK